MCKCSSKSRTGTQRTELVTELSGSELPVCGSKISVATQNITNLFQLTEAAVLVILGWGSGYLGLFCWRSVSDLLLQRCGGEHLQLHHCGPGLLWRWCRGRSSTTASTQPSLPGSAPPRSGSTSSSCPEVRADAPGQASISIHRWR